jgi:hypothetical protein
MNESFARTTKKALLASLAGVLVPLTLLSAQPPAAQPPDKGPPPPPPKGVITLKDRHGHCTPHRSGCAHTGAGTIDVAQPKDDTVVFTMYGVAVAGPHPCYASSASMDFDLVQCLDIAFSDEKVKKGKVVIDARIIGLLRGDSNGGAAAVSNGAAALTSGGSPVVALAIEGHSVAGCESLAINDHKGPVTVPFVVGEFTYHQCFNIVATHARGLCGKAASAEFAPDPALDPLWISYWEPFHGAAKKDFGFQVTVHVDPE